MASASQFIQIKRLQTGINGRIANTKSKRANDTYEGYAGSSLVTLPPNTLLSNKFIVPESGGGGGDCPVNFGLPLIFDEVSGNLLLYAGAETTITAPNFCIEFNGTTSVIGDAIASVNFVFVTDGTLTDSNISVSVGTQINRPIIVTNKGNVNTAPVIFTTPISDLAGIKFIFSNVTFPLTVSSDPANLINISLTN